MIVPPGIDKANPGKIAVRNRSAKRKVPKHLRVTVIDV